MRANDFLGPKTYSKNLVPLAHCIWSGFHYEKANEAEAEDATEEVE